MPCDIKYLWTSLPTTSQSGTQTSFGKQKRKRAMWPRKSIRPAHAPHRSPRRRWLIGCEQRIHRHDTNTTSERCALNMCTILNNEIQQAHRIQPNHVHSFSEELRICGTAETDAPASWRARLAGGLFFRKVYAIPDRYHTLVLHIASIPRSTLVTPKSEVLEHHLLAREATTPTSQTLSVPNPSV